MLLKGGLKNSWWFQSAVAHELISNLDEVTSINESGVSGFKALSRMSSFPTLEQQHDHDLDLGELEFQSAVAHELISNASTPMRPAISFSRFKALSRMSSFPTRHGHTVDGRRYRVSKRCRA